MEIHCFIIYLIFLWSYPSNCDDSVSILVKLEGKRVDAAFSLPKSKSEDRKEKAQYPDTNDYYKYPLCVAIYQWLRETIFATVAI